LFVSKVISRVDKIASILLPLSRFGINGLKGLISQGILAEGEGSSQATSGVASCLLLIKPFQIMF